MNKDKEHKQIQYSKLLPILTGLMFAACLIVGFVTDFSTVVDVSFYVTAITVSAGIWGSTIVFYLKKSQAENNVKLKTEMYKVASKERLKYNEQMMKLKKKYSMSDEDIEDIENESPMDEFASNALSAIEEVINVSEVDADSPVELQTY